ncbi:uncharacterized protein LOC141907352 [Tubulanus polymorphus]|uniref:uncharacterized protein LOC141907352 n=1 Tax=Tubulanus polymorphus TaxID=672921 RepID=UPI003DA3C8EC
MDSKNLIYVSIAVLFVVVVAAGEISSSKLESLQKYLGEEPNGNSAEDSADLYDLSDDKRGALLRYGRGSIMRFGKRGNMFRYGKRGSIMRFGKRQLFRYGKRDEDDQAAEAEDKRSLLRYGKRFVRDTKREKAHVPFRFGREEVYDM